MRLFPVFVALVGTLVGMSAPPTASAREPVRVIFDTDMDTDCDDIGALAVLHALADLGEVEILATVASSLHPWSPACIDVLNTYYGRPNIPLGRAVGRGVLKASKYAQPLAERFPHKAGPAEKVPAAVAVYRQILESQPDASVVIVTVGYLTKIAELLRSPGGVDLVRRKVRE
jgi:inosine-uridine nucleoside N-ribohydrolase